MLICVWINKFVIYIYTHTSLFSTCEFEWRNPTSKFKVLHAHAVTHAHLLMFTRWAFRLQGQGLLPWRAQACLCARGSNLERNVDRARNVKWTRLACLWPAVLFCLSFAAIFFACVCIIVERCNEWNRDDIGHVWSAWPEPRARR